MRTTRRHFIQAGGAAAAVAAQARAQRVAANDRIQIALIGAGGMGSEDVRSALAVQGVEIVAAADVYDGRLMRAKEVWGKHLFTTRDYREVLARPEIDAVIVATPDHWHAQIAIDAMKAGKDVYVEKPMVQKVAEGKALVETEKATGRILQVGSQRVSSIVYKKAKELLRAGAIGEFNMIEAWWDRNSAIGAWQYSIPPDAIDRTHRLGPVPGSRAEAAVRAGAAVPVAQLSGLRHRRGGRSVRAPVQRDALHHRVAGADTRVRDGRTAVLEGRSRRAGRDARAVRLSGDGEPSRVHADAAGELRRTAAAGVTCFRFVGSEGVMTVAGNVTVARQPRETEPGYTVDTFAKETQEKYLDEYREEVSAPDADRRCDPAAKRGEVLPAGWL